MTLADFAPYWTPSIVLGAATLCGAVGFWLMLPRPDPRGRLLGVLIALVALGLVASQVPRLSSWASQSVFYILAAITLIAAGATVTLRSPGYCAIWFALSLLGTAGLFLFQGAQFLGVATIVVYAGAILVTFLFVLMLAQPTGQAYYDRLSWEAMLSAITGSLMAGILTLTIVSVFQAPTPHEHPIAAPSQAKLSEEILADEHMAHLGSQLFSRHLLAVEIAGTLLLVALVGSIAIASRGGQPGSLMRRRTHG